MTLTETKTYKKKNTKTHIHRQRKKLSASKTQCMLYLIKAGGFKDSKYYIGCLVMTKTKTQFYELLGMDIFQGRLVFRDAYFLGVNIFQG